MGGRAFSFWRGSCSIVMKRVLIYNNFLRDGDESVLASNVGRRHRYCSRGPGRFRSNPYGRTKHIAIVDLVRRLCAGILLVIRSLRYDVLAVDSALTGMIVACVLPPL